MAEMNIIGWPGWETVGLIGRGSFGAVYEIQRNVLGNVEKAALKVISIPQNASDIDEMISDGYDNESITSTFQAHLKSIVAEYALMRKMNGSSNIVNCDDVRYVQHDDGFGWDIYIKMELLTPLAKTLTGSISDETVIRLAQDMCAALNLCQKHGIIHRDIKPQNIFLSDNGDYKLGDFGVAKTVEKTSGGTKIGTYKYMAPEVYNNQPYGVGADIYSLGMVLYWMLNERRMPFLPLPPERLRAGMDEAARNRRLAGEAFGPPAHGSDQLKQIVMKACAYDPAERYRTAQEMLDDLNLLQSDHTMGIFGGYRMYTNKGVYARQEEPTDPRPDLSGGTGDQPQYQTDPIEPENGTSKDQKKKKKGLLGLIIGGVLAVIILVILLLLRSCDTKLTERPRDDGDSETTVATEPEYEMSISQEELNLVVDTTVGLTVSGLPEDAEIEWRSDNKKVATVDENGQVTGISEGTAIISAQWEYGRKTYRVESVVTVESSGIILSSYNVVLTYIGQTAVLEGTTYPEGQTILWTSSDGKVVTVSEDGTVTAVGEGEAVITASFGSCTADCSVTVAMPSVTLDQAALSLYPGDTSALSAAVEPEGAQIMWTSSDEGVVRVKDGALTAVGTGIAVITARIVCDEHEYEASCQVTVATPSVSLSSTSLSLLPGKSSNLTVTTKPGGAEVSWSSSNTAVATVSDGKVTAVAPGSATITAQITCGGKTYKTTCAVTVTTPSVSLNYSDVSIALGDQFVLKASVTPSDAQVSWSSSNTSVATVSGGTVKTVAPGSATITAQITYGEKTYKATCTVRVLEPTISVTSSASTITYSPRDKDTCTLTATVNPDGGSVSWTSSDTSVATVSGNGTNATVTAVSDGTVTITATYTLNGNVVSDSCSIMVSKAASKLKLVGLSYSETGNVHDFKLSGTLESNYELDRMECYGVARSLALDLSVNDRPDPYYFPDGCYEFNVANMADHFVSQYEALYTLYVVAAKLLGADTGVEFTVYCTCYDASGNSINATIVYTVYA